METAISIYSRYIGQLVINALQWVCFLLSFHYFSHKVSKTNRIKTTWGGWSVVSPLMQMLLKGEGLIFKAVLIFVVLAEQSIRDSCL